MPMPNGMFFDFRDILFKMAIFFGAFIIIYGVLWLLVELSIIPVIFLAIFPQIILILIGIFIIYIAFTKRNAY
jgi:hypothetical protein